jgi:catechol 2,3-dioxygenase-like lactoylglutathione lyase family enzyme
MPSRLAVIVINAIDPEVVADFWCAVLGWTVLEREPDGITIGDAEGSWPTIDIFAVPDAKTVKNRLHFDLRADGLPTSDELGRLIALGARHVDVGQPADASWVVLADPEGNEFCLLSRSVQQMTERA